ncbi:MAG: cell envelope integrity protein TolA [Pseudomonadota bacterium]
MKPYPVNRKESYRFTLLLATLFHILLFSALFLTLRYSAKPLFLTTIPTLAIIHATAIAIPQLPISDSLKEEKTKLIPKIDKKVVIKPELIEKSPVVLAIKEKKPPKIPRATTPIVAKSRVKNPRVKNTVAIKKSPLDKAVVHKPSIVKEKNTRHLLSPRSLKMAEKNVQKLLQEEVNMLAQQQQIAARNAATTDKYRHLILQSIAQQWIVPPKLNKHLETKLAVHLAPGGMVLEVIVVKSSGNSVLDRSAQTAVYKASPLPVPKNTALFNTFRQINLTVRPEGVITQ